VYGANSEEMCNKTFDISMYSVVVAPSNSIARPWQKKLLVTKLEKVIVTTVITYY
jgi:hypothetical protein